MACRGCILACVYAVMFVLHSKADTCLDVSIGCTILSVDLQPANLGLPLQTTACSDVIPCDLDINSTVIGEDPVNLCVAAGFEINSCTNSYRPFCCNFQTLTPTLSPTTPDPTLAPSLNPTKNPTTSPSTNPTRSPTRNPTGSPTPEPTGSPTVLVPTSFFESQENLIYVAAGGGGGLLLLIAMVVLLRRRRAGSSDDDNQVAPASGGGKKMKLDEKSDIFDWEKHIDKKSGEVYFFNPKTGESRWDPPEVSA